MIDWLTESAQNLTDPPEWFLSPTELARYASFRFDKRRRDWLLGRWTAKRLLQAVQFERTGQFAPLETFEIANDADGTPYAIPNSQRRALSLSISHSHDWAFCACLSPLAEPIAWARVPSPSAGLGADMEWIEPRPGNFVGDYFTPAEIAQITAALPAERAVLTTAIWSAKEAVLKALRMGLRVDTRAVEITLMPPAPPPAPWASFGVSTTLAGGAVLNGWWHVWDGFVLTLATSGADAPAREPLAPESVLLADSAAIEETHDQGHGPVHRRIAYATRHHPRHAPRH
jgi:4'-phosphopantetheinyl transferase